MFERLSSFTYSTEFGLQYAKLKLKTAQIDQKNNSFKMASSFKLSRWCFVSDTSMNRSIGLDKPASIQIGCELVAFEVQ